MDETTRGLVFCGFLIIQKGEKKNKEKMMGIVKHVPRISTVVCSPAFRQEAAFAATTSNPVPLLLVTV